MFTNVFKIDRFNLGQTYITDKKFILENRHRDIIERFDLLSCAPRKDLRDVGNVDSYGAFHVELQQVLVKFRERVKKIRYQKVAYLINKV